MANLCGEPGNAVGSGGAGNAQRPGTPLAAGYGIGPSDWARAGVARKGRIHAHPADVVGADGSSLNVGGITLTRSDRRLMNAVARQPGLQAGADRAPACAAQGR